MCRAAKTFAEAAGGDHGPWHNMHLAMSTSRLRASMVTVESALAGAGTVVDLPEAKPSEAKPNWRRPNLDPAASTSLETSVRTAACRDLTSLGAPQTMMTGGGGLDGLTMDASGPQKTNVRSV